MIWEKCPLCGADMLYQDVNSGTSYGYYYCPNANKPGHKQLEKLNPHLKGK